MAEGTTNILSTMNRSGSGLEIGTLVKNLVAAETASERSLIERDIEATEVSISAMGTLSQRVGGFDSALGTIAVSGTRITGTSGPAVAIAVTDEAAARDVNTDITVQRLATSQVVSFELGAGIGAASAVGAESFDLQTAGDPPKTLGTITLTPGQRTVAGLAAALNDVPGVAANLVETGDGRLTLIVKSDLGVANALSGQRNGDGSTTGSIDALRSALDGGGVSAVASVAVTAATDAAFTVDGVAVTRPANVIDDLFAGHRVTLALPTPDPVTVTSTRTVESARLRLEALVAEINGLKTYLAEATQRGLNGAEPGPLAGDPTARAIQDRLRGLTTEPMAGYGGTPVFLSQLGVRTERDGTLTIDPEAFDRALAANPTALDAVFVSRYSSASPALDVSGLRFAPPQPGRYGFDPAQPALLSFDAAGAVSGTVALDKTTRDGTTSYRAASGPAAGLVIRVAENGEPAGVTDVFYGRSLLETLKGWSSSLLGQSGTIANAEKSLTAVLAEREDRLTGVEEKVEALTARYSERFGQMEALVTSLNKTGEYLTSLMDAWNRKD